MKKIILSATIILLSVTSIFAQRFAYVDTEYILDKIPEYTNAQKQLDDIVGVWNNEIEQKYNEVKTLYSKYQAEEFLLTDEMKKKRQEEIITKEQIANNLQEQRFGFEGDLFKKRQELIQPIQEKVYNAIEKISTNLGYDFIFDKSAGGSTMLFTNSKYDLSEQVLKAIKF
ncbi:MAG TPA: OmpH family outer membrane protein [Chitinophagales bacterium]|nr:OmpH family outer membrane protein [Chitinophagales bacterium]